MFIPAEPCEPSCPMQLNQNVVPPAPPPSAPAPGQALAPTPGTSGVGTGANGAGGVAVLAHHSPYDLRRKSPSSSHHPVDAGGGVAGPSTSAATATSNGMSPASPATPTAPAQGYSAAMLPARKRPRRTCSASYESKCHNTVMLHNYIMPCINISDVAKNQLIPSILEIKVLCVILMDL